MLLQHALRTVDGWPTLLGGGCCAYRVGERMAVPVPVEVRQRFAAAAPRGLLCEAGGDAGGARCAVDLALRATKFLHSLTERHHALLLEHVTRAADAEMKA